MTWVVLMSSPHSLKILQLQQAQRQRHLLFILSLPHHTQTETLISRSSMAKAFALLQLLFVLFLWLCEMNPLKTDDILLNTTGLCAWTDSFHFTYAFIEQYC